MDFGVGSFAGWGDHKAVLVSLCRLLAWLLRNTWSNIRAWCTLQPIQPRVAMTHYVIQCVVVSSLAAGNAASGNLQAEWFSTMLGHGWPLRGCSGRVRWTTYASATVASFGKACHAPLPSGSSGMSGGHLLSSGRADPVRMRCLLRRRPGMPTRSQLLLRRARHEYPLHPSQLRRMEIRTTGTGVIHLDRTPSHVSLKQPRIRACEQPHLSGIRIDLAAAARDKPVANNRARRAHRSHLISRL